MTNKSSSQASRKTLGTIAGLLTVVSVAVVYFTLNPITPSLDEAPFQELGRRLAQEAMQLQQPGSRIVLITRDATQFKTPAYQGMVRGFEQALQKAGVKLATSRILKVDPLRVVAVPPGEFAELFSKLEDRDIIVSLLGPPNLDAAQVAALGNRRPRVLAVCSGALPQQINLRRLFEANLLHTAVISRNEPASAGHTMDQLFKLISAANLSDLPAPIASMP